ncbi:PREDICTED: DDRGK domain-containing protein 1 [Ceratosolen solmsi marchali]|uniref:DDRGK domain-containing protein 1 n=1 Tax=Ceratosolen solmsi marchali TaxID=326594 RepID=A0AAJ6YM01_9HYME|nr:PREDICTED: DDRGK domain-containing protein 1 [Ceratosolen solmsi marchali]
MDVVVLSCIALLLVVLIILITFYSKGSARKNEAHDAAGPEASGQRAFAHVTARGVRQRRHQVANVEDHYKDEIANDESASLKKLGAKKRAKLEAKAERKTQREIEEQERKLKKEQQLLIDQQRDKELEHEAEIKRLEMLRQQKIEQEEEVKYQNLKKAFSVENEGYEEKVDIDSESFQNQIVEYLKYHKVVILEELGQRFGLETMSVIKKVQDMQANGTLSGVIDDRGKFIYVSEKELESVAAFVKQRGRISIFELAECSNELISLGPGAAHEPIEV